MQKSATLRPGWTVEMYFAGLGFGYVVARRGPSGVIVNVGTKLTKGEAERLYVSIVQHYADVAYKAARERAEKVPAQLILVHDE